MGTVIDALFTDARFYAKLYIFYPNEETQIFNQQKFLVSSRFTQVLGYLDGTHVPILAHARNEYMS